MLPRRRQVSSRQFLGAGPQALPSCPRWGTQAPSAPLTFRLLRRPRLGARSLRPRPTQAAATGRSQRRERGVQPLAARPGSARRRPWRGLGALQDAPPARSLGSPSSPAGLRLREREAPGEKAGIHLLTHSADGWLHGAPNGRSLTVGRVGQGPTGSGADQRLSRTTNGAVVTAACWGRRPGGAGPWLTGTSSCSNPPALACVLSRFSPA